MVTAGGLKFRVIEMNDCWALAEVQEESFWTEFVFFNKLRASISFLQNFPNSDNIFFSDLYILWGYIGWRESVFQNVFFFYEYQKEIENQL